MKVYILGDEYQYDGGIWIHSVYFERSRAEERMVELDKEYSESLFVKARLEIKEFEVQ